MLDANIIPDGDEYIYFVAEDPFTGFIKIGKTTCIEKRLSGMQTGNPRKLNILLKILRPVKYDYERIFHKLLFNNHVRGEWYSINLKTLLRIEIITRFNRYKEELSCLLSEFIKYDSDWIINDDKIFLNSPAVKSGRCGSKFHGKLLPKKVKHNNEPIIYDVEPRYDLISIDHDLIPKSEEISYERFSKLSVKNRLSKEERSSVNKYILRAKYSYAGEMDLEWVKKYSDKKVLAMNKHIASRNVNINELVAASELLLINTTDTDRMIKHKTDFMYNVARTKIRDIYDKYNRTAEFSVKMVEYINREIEINNPIYGGVKLKNSNTKYVLLAVNDVLMNLGYEIRISKVHKQTDRNKKIYEFEWFDISSDYYNLPNKNEKNNKKPDFPNFRYLQLT